MNVTSFATNPVGTIAAEGLQKLEQSNDLHPTLERLAKTMPSHSNHAAGAFILGFAIPIFGNTMAAEAHDVEMIINLAKGMTEKMPDAQGFHYLGIEYNDRPYSIAAVVSPDVERNENKVIFASDAPNELKECLEGLVENLMKNAIEDSNSINSEPYLSYLEGVISQYNSELETFENNLSEAQNLEYERYIELSDNYDEVTEEILVSYYADPLYPNIPYPELPPRPQLPIFDSTVEFDGLPDQVSAPIKIVTCSL